MPIDYEKSSCGVGFVADRHQRRSHAIVSTALHALRCVEHRGACGADGVTGDGAGVMIDIPFELLGIEAGTSALGTLFLQKDKAQRAAALALFEETFGFYGLDIASYRQVPVNEDVLGVQARQTCPGIVHAVISRPPFCRTDASFAALLYQAKQTLRTKGNKRGLSEVLYLTSLSPSTVVYKALTTAGSLAHFYPDLQDPRVTSRFALFHRRFSTNTATTWDKAQPFRLIAHNGEINTIFGNRSWAYSREQSLGLPRDALLTHQFVSDSGNLNEMAEALKYRSSIPDMEDILAIMIPPAETDGDYYAFWSRAMEPWDGPAFVTYSDGETIGARLDRNGFRPGRWTLTEDRFYLASEAGIFAIAPQSIQANGALRGGSGVMMNLHTGEVHFDDPSTSRENRDAHLDARLLSLAELAQRPPDAPSAGAAKARAKAKAGAKADADANAEAEAEADSATEAAAFQHPALSLAAATLFGLTHDEWITELVPMLATGKEAIGSMGDTARPAILSDELRSFFDFFYQDFAQVTNPPLDYLREEMVTDLGTFLGRRPNIFEPKQLIPPTQGLSLDCPFLTLQQAAFVHGLQHKRPSGVYVRSASIDTTFARSAGGAGLASRLDEIATECVAAVEGGASILVLSDSRVCDASERLPVPSLLGLRAAVTALNREGLRLETSLVVETGDARTTHHMAALVAFGATAICPYVLWQMAAQVQALPKFLGGAGGKLKAVDSAQAKANVLQVLSQGLLKIMSKMGISVVRSYQSSKLFTPLGLADDVLALFGTGPSRVGGWSLQDLGARLCARDVDIDKLARSYVFKEHPRGREGEHHAMTAARSKLVHHLVRKSDAPQAASAGYAEYVQAGQSGGPVHLRHLLELVPAAQNSQAAAPADAVQSVNDILRTFGSGAMSFGAISAESQRDIFLAMKAIGGRSNSGEGGENPNYFTDGTTATIKQVASGRFGVTAQYLVSGEQLEIKVAQGAKPGEGGQLMGAKVDADIARARHASVGVDLISPAPLHDIYSIEDLKQLIYELKQLHPRAPVCVKLVAGKNIGTIAVGVAKAGADIIHVSGGSGGTGAAPLSSMKHAGLPWELGLVETHDALVQSGLRDTVILRVDGGFHVGADVVMAAALGADEFNFGKLLLVAQGCIMARICEKNTCPTGIATHDPKFKKKYQGTPQHVERMLRLLAQEVRTMLQRLGVASLQAIRGQRRLLRAAPQHAGLMRARGLDLSSLLRVPDARTVAAVREPKPPVAPLNGFNQQVMNWARPLVEAGQSGTLALPIQTTDRAALASLAGLLATHRHNARVRGATQDGYAQTLELTLTGSAGQGFAAFAVDGMQVTLEGEANDSVCKSMSGGCVAIRASPDIDYRPEENAIIGNGALYGATGGELLVGGLAGDRFAVRNSGACTVVEGVGMHACEYMTGGVVVILGQVSQNLGAGMSGGVVFVRKDQLGKVNRRYLRQAALTDDDRTLLEQLLARHHASCHAHTSGRPSGQTASEPRIPCHSRAGGNSAGMTSSQSGAPGGTGLPRALVKLVPISQSS